jgi:prophage DNA circulation protein
MATDITFENWVIPATRLGIGSDCRVAIHEYRFVKGGSIEDHGRGLYTFRMNATFTNDPRYRPALYPDQLSQLRALYDSRKIGTLVLPDIGRVLCRIVQCDSEQEFRNPNSADVSIAFLEDLGNRFLPVVTSAATQAGFQDSAQKWASLVDSKRPEQYESTASPDVQSQQKRAFDLFDQLTNAANAIIGIRDQIQLQNELLAAKIQGFRSLLEEVDHALWLNDPMNFEFVYALKDLWAATLALANEPQQQGQQGLPRTYKVQRTSTVTQISAAIYGDTSRARDLLGLNDFPDAMAIPAGTDVLYLQAA